MKEVSQTETLPDVGLEIIRASEITPKEVKWLWYPYFPFGKVVIIQGDPGCGKSKFMLTLSALLSKGRPIPFSDDDELYEPMTVIYQTTEDDADDTVVPRFIESDGDPYNLLFIREDKKGLTFGDSRIKEAIVQHKAKLLILDPFSSYIGEGRSLNQANEMRAEFNHLIAVGRETGCCIVIIAHMNKMEGINPVYRTSGSIDIVGAARGVLAVVKTDNKQNPDERVLVQVKSKAIEQKAEALARVQRERRDAIATGVTERNWVTMFRQYENIDELNRRVLMALVDKVLIHENHVIEIIFKYRDEYERALSYAAEYTEAVKKAV